MKQTEQKTTLVTAYAKAPQGTAMSEVYKYAGIILEIDLNHTIVNADFTFVSELSKDFLKRLLVGYNLANGIGGLVNDIETHYFAPSTNSVIVALKAANKRYFERINT